MTELNCSKVDTKIQELINVNELQDEFLPIISEIKWCQSKIPRKPPKLKDKTYNIPCVTNSSAWYNECIRQKWRTDYTVPDNYIDLSESPKIEAQGEAISEIKTTTSHKVGDVISSIEAVSGVFPKSDIRPKVFDNITKQWVLLDSGSCVSCVPASPSDSIDPSFKLRSVNGGQIDTYGTKRMSLRLGRKEYHINAVIAAIPTPIFGWDIFDKYKLSLDWNDQGDLVVMDKKADISSVLKHEVVD